MSHIPAAGRSPLPAAFDAANSVALDPASILLALSAQQAQILQTTLVSQLVTGRSQVGRVADLGSAAHEASQWRERTMATELDAINNLQSEIETARQRYMGGEASTLAVSGADNDRLKEWISWAAERGVDLAPMTKLEELPEPPVETSAPGDSAAAADSPTAGAGAPAGDSPVPPPPPRVLIDGAAFDRNLSRLAAYAVDVAAGRVDNPAVRRALADDPAADALVARLRGLGYDGSLLTLVDLGKAVDALNGMAQGALSQLQATANVIKSLGELSAATAGKLTGLLDQTAATQERTAESRALDAQLERLRAGDEFRAELQDLAAQLDAAEHAMRARQISPEMVAQLSEQLTDVARSQLDRQLAEWTLDFAAHASPPPTPATHNANAALRRNYM